MSAAATSLPQSRPFLRGGRRVMPTGLRLVPLASLMRHAYIMVVTSQRENYGRFFARELNRARNSQR